MKGYSWGIIRQLELTSRDETGFPKIATPVLDCRFPRSPIHRFRLLAGQCGGAINCVLE